MPKSRNAYVANMHFNAIRENKILAKISEFTVVLIVSLTIQIHCATLLQVMCLFQSPLFLAF